MASFFEQAITAQLMGPTFPYPKPVSASPTVMIEHRKPRTVPFADLPVGSAFISSLGTLRLKVQETFLLGSGIQVNVLDPSTGGLQQYAGSTRVTPVSSVHIQVKE